MTLPSDSPDFEAASSLKPCAPLAANRRHQPVAVTWFLLGVYPSPCCSGAGTEGQGRERRRTAGPWSPEVTLKKQSVFNRLLINPKLNGDHRLVRL